MQFHSNLLPKRPAKMPDELPMSHMARVAWENGFINLQEFCYVTGVNTNALAKMPLGVAKRLAAWTGSTPAELQRFSFPAGYVIPFGNGLVTRTQLHTKGFRYCSLCVADDLMTGLPYIRGTWQWGMVSNCAIHECPLKEYTRGVLHLTTFASLAADFVDTVKTPCGADEYLQGRLLGKVGASFLDEMPAYVAAEFCAVLGQFKQGMIDRRVTERVEGGYGNSKIRQQGFEIAWEGRKAIQEFLTHYVETVCARIHGPRRIYSPFLHWASLNKHKPEYHSIMRLFQDHAEENVPLAPGEAIVWPVTRRKVHSLRTAAVEYGISEERVERVLKTKMGVERLPTFIKKDDIHSHLLEAASHVPTSQAAAQVGCHIRLCDEMIKEGLLTAVPNRVEEGRVYRLVHRFEIDKFIRQLEGIINRAIDPADLVPFNKVYGRNIRRTELLRLALEGRVVRIGHVGGTADIAGLLFDEKEVREVISSIGKQQETTKIHDPDLIDLTAARRRLRVTKSTIDEIVRLQLVPSMFVSGQGGRKNIRTMISTATLDAFDAEHVQLDELAIIHRRDSHDISRQLAVCGVYPLFGGHRQIARFYRKVDVEPHGLL